MPQLDAVVVGSGPNGLGAAVALAQAGLAVRVLEAQPTAGGGTRTEALTLPGFRHDVCSAAHPLGVSSPFFRSLPLGEHGLEWVQPALPLAHPLDGGEAALVSRSLDETCEGLGEDGPAWRKLFGPFAARWGQLLEDVLRPVGVPRHPWLFGRFGLLSLRSAARLARSRFRGGRARALLAGMAAHGCMPLERAPTASFAVMLGASAHAAGWPLARGGSQAIADALVGVLRSLGGEVETGAPVRAIADLPPARVVLFDLTPRQLLAIGGDRLPARYRRALARFRHGPGVFKVDWALGEPIPWEVPACRQAGTLHLGGTLEEIAASERAVWDGAPPERPYAIVVQATPFDPGRAPAGRHTAWAYCHVPNGSTADMTERIEAKVERFAPGFRDCILARSSLGPPEMEAHNANYLGGDISGGVQDLRQTFFRPVAGLHPYTVPVPGWYLCSSSTPPGGGVHGMCGYHAARAALRDLARAGRTR